MKSKALAVRGLTFALSASGAARGDPYRAPTPARGAQVAPLAHDEVDTLRLANDVNWVVLAAGASELMPREDAARQRPKGSPNSPNPTVALAVGLGQLSARVRF